MHAECRPFPFIINNYFSWETTKEIVFFFYLVLSETKCVKREKGEEDTKEQERKVDIIGMNCSRYQKWWEVTGENHLSSFPPSARQHALSLSLSPTSYNHLTCYPLSYKYTTNTSFSLFHLTNIVSTFYIHIYVYTQVSIYNTLLICIYLMFTWMDETHGGSEPILPLCILNITRVSFHAFTTIRHRTKKSNLLV